MEMKEKMDQILFLDLETVSQEEMYETLSPSLRKLWDRKAELLKNPEEEDSSSLYAKKAGIYAEFGKIICIGLAYLHLLSTGEYGLRVTCLKGENEVELLQRFIDLIEHKFDWQRLRLCAHNGKEFDFPYLCRRMIINQLEIPAVLDISGKKPWEINHLDTMEMWKFGDRKQFTSLDLLASVLGIPSSKNDIDGSMVNETYYKQKNLNRIAAYCKKDVIVSAQVFMRLTGNQPLNPEHILEVDEP